MHSFDKDNDNSVSTDVFDNFMYWQSMEAAEEPAPTFTLKPTPNNLMQQFVDNYERLEIMAKRLRQMLKEHPELLIEQQTAKHAQYVLSISESWTKEAAEIAEQLVATKHQSTHTHDEWLAEIKRGRWCHICGQSAKICEPEMLLPKFFCSLDCQLAYYDDEE